jgi:hypothetical protein
LDKPRTYTQFITVSRIFEKDVSKEISIKFLFGYRLPQYFGYVPNNYSQLFSVHGVSDLRQTELHTAQPTMPKLSALDTEMVTEQVKIHITKY